jgi:hypothetical protein
MRQKALIFLLAVIALGCSGSRPTASPTLALPAASAPATAPSFHGVMDILVRIELNRNCFGTPTTPAPATSPVR